MPGLEAIDHDLPNPLDRIERLGGWLVDQDVRPGDVVAVLMKNSAASTGATLAMPE